MQATQQSAAPLRVVIDMTDGGIRVVYADHPVEIVFFSYATKDVTEYGDGFADPAGKPVGLWMDGSEHPAEDAATVDWFFGQYKGPSHRLTAARAVSVKRPPMNRIQQELFALINNLRGCHRPHQAVRERSAEVIEAVCEIHGILSDEEFCADRWDDLVRALSSRGLGPLEMDSELDAEGLDDKYSPKDAWGEHPKFPRQDWQHEVANGDTQGGYWEWVCNQVANHE